MSPIDIFALIVLLSIIATIVAIVVFLGMWPGKVAKERNHPQVEAITIGSWVALFSGGILWPIILIWAYLKPIAKPYDLSKDEEKGGAA